MGQSVTRGQGSIYEAAWPKPEADQPRPPFSSMNDVVTMMFGSRRPSLYVDGHEVEEGVRGWPLPKKPLRRSTVTVGFVYDPERMTAEDVALRICELVEDGDGLGENFHWRAERTHAWGTPRSWIPRHDDVPPEALI